MSAKQLSQLQAKSYAALQLGAKFAAIMRWSEPYYGLARALVAWGRGGSHAACIATLEGVAKRAEAGGLRFAKALAHLYSAIVMHRDAQGRGAVVKELRRVVEDEVSSPNFASRMAHRYLGTKDKRRELRPASVFKSKVKLRRSTGGLRSFREIVRTETEGGVDTGQGKGNLNESELRALGARLASRKGNEEEAGGFVA